MLPLLFEKYIWIQLSISTCLNLAYINLGYAMGWTAAIMTKFQDPDQTPLGYTLTPTDTTWVILSVVPGLMVGTQLIATSSVGRKPCILFGSIVLLLSNIMLIFANSFSLMIAARIIIGGGVGILMVMATVYIGEIASTNIRGIALSSGGIFLSFGTLYVFGIGPYVSYRTVGYCILPFCIIPLIGSIFIPESPMYYVIKGDDASARETLIILGRENDIDQELKSLSDIVNEQKNNKENWTSAFTVKSNRDALIINIILYILQTCNGSIFVMLYVTKIFQESGSSIAPDVATIIVGATNFIVSLGVPFFVEKVGRRILLLWSLVGCFVTMVTLSVYFYLNAVDQDYIKHVRWLPLAALMVMNIFYSIGLSIIPNTISGEMFRPSLRSISTSIAVNCGYAIATLSLLLVTYLTTIVGNYVVYGLYAIINVLGFVFVIFVLPETKGKALSEINMLMVETKTF